MRASQQAQCRKERSRRRTQGDFWYIRSAQRGNGLQYVRRGSGDDREGGGTTACLLFPLGAGDVRVGARSSDQHTLRSGVCALSGVANDRVWYINRLGAPGGSSSSCGPRTSASAIEKQSKDQAAAHLEPFSRDFFGNVYVTYRKRTTQNTVTEHVM